MRKNIIVTITAMLSLATVAAADLTPIGDPIDGESWKQRFQESGIGSFDLMAVRIVAGGPFQTPSFSGFSSGSNWSLVSEVFDSGSTTRVVTAVARGPARTSLQWDWKWFGSSSQPLQFDYVVFNTNSNTVRLAQRVKWKVGTSGWSYENFAYGNNAYWAPTRAQVQAIPAPGAVLLGMLGLGLVGWVKRRFG